MSKKKRIDPIPEEFTSYEEAAEFWDTHDTTDYLDAFHTVEVATKFRSRHYEIEIEKDVFKVLKEQARKKGITISHLANQYLRHQFRMTKGNTTKEQSKTTLSIECPCQTTANPILKWDLRRKLNAFRSLRDQCAALREILVPKDIWDQFEYFALEPMDDAYHVSILLNAFEQGCLHRIAIPVHIFLLDGNTVRREVTDQYRSDLRETWFHKKDTLKRHRKSRIFLGRISELTFAYWLKLNGYDVKELEATAPKNRAVCDVVASDPIGNILSFESKYIGTEDLDFELMIQRLQGGRVVGNVSPYSAANYLLFQVFSAAKQVQDHAEAGSQKIVAIMISEMTWSRFDIPLIEGWIDWTNPKFFPGDKKWKEFLADQKQKNPQLEKELKPIIGNLDGIIFMLMGSDYEITLKKRVNL